MKKTPSAFSLDKTKRICKRKIFLSLQKKGRRSFGKFLVLVAKINKSLPLGQFGITVSKNVGKAHERNKVKRRLRHIIRLNQHLLNDKQLVIMARPSARDCSFTDLCHDLFSTYKRLLRDI